MKQIKTESGNILCVEVPEEAYLIDSIDNPKFKYSVRFVNCPEINNVEYKELEPLGKLLELTDKDCEEFVEKDIKYGNFRDYRGLIDSEEVIHPYYDYKHATNSFISLLQSEGIDTSKELLIIKVL